ncbi:Hint domain-containing protein [Roseovarius aestuarii]|nr:Hint domain-containing protein [Roseovarius aestuarii]
MGTPTIGGTTTGNVTENSGAIVDGDLEDIGTFSGTTDDTFSITSAATYGTASINPSTGVWTYDLNDADPTVQALDPGETMTDVFTVRMVDNDGGVDTQVITITIHGAVCFAGGTLIRTPQGPCLVEDLRPGMQIQTLGHGAQTLLWLGRQRISADDMADNARLRPILIKAGALGCGLPTRDLRVSRQHRMLIRGPVVQDIFGTAEILVPAIWLVGIQGITMAEANDGIDYFHLLLDQHHVVFANDAPSESFLTGPEALKTLPDSDRADIARILPQTALPGHSPAPARPIPANGREMRQFRKALSRVCGSLLQDMSELVHG